MQKEITKLIMVMMVIKMTIMDKTDKNRLCRRVDGWGSLLTIYPWNKFLITVIHTC